MTTDSSPIPQTEVRFSVIEQMTRVRVNDRPVGIIVQMGPVYHDVAGLNEKGEVHYQFLAYEGPTDVPIGPYLKVREDVTHYYQKGQHAQQTG